MNEEKMNAEGEIFELWKQINPEDIMPSQSKELEQFFNSIPDYDMGVGRGEAIHDALMKYTNQIEKGIEGKCVFIIPGDQLKDGKHAVYIGKQHITMSVIGWLDSMKDFLRNKNLVEDNIKNVSIYFRVI